MKKKYLVTSILAAAALSANGAAIHTGLLNYWTLDGDANDTAGSYAESTGTTTDNGTVDQGGGAAGTVGFSGGGLFGSAAQFQRANGLNGRIDINDQGADTNRTGLNLSVSVWVQHDSSDSQQTNWQSILAHGEQNDYRIARDGGTGNTSGAAYAGGTGDIRNVGGVSLYSGDWIHIVATTTHNVGTELFVNGTSVATNANATTAIVRDGGGDNLWLGANPEGADRMWDGLIDDVGMWDRVLTPAEISQIYQAGQAGTSLGAIPEPSVSILGSLMAFMLAARRRR